MNGVMKERGPKLAAEEYPEIAISVKGDSLRKGMSNIDAPTSSDRMPHIRHGDANAATTRILDRCISDSLSWFIPREEITAQSAHKDTEKSAHGFPKKL
jgi:hypothetical protein